VTDHSFFLRFDFDIFAVEKKEEESVCRKKSTPHYPGVAEPSIHHLSILLAGDAIADACRGGNVRAQLVTDTPQKGM
jgi:hypothetical protein